jgi:hypothetical protein
LGKRLSLARICSLPNRKVGTAKDDGFNECLMKVADIDKSGKKQLSKKQRNVLNLLKGGKTARWEDQVRKVIDDGQQT